MRKNIGNKVLIFSGSDMRFGGGGQKNVINISKKLGMPTKIYSVLCESTIRVPLSSLAGLEFEVIPSICFKSLNHWFPYGILLLLNDKSTRDSYAMITFSSNIFVLFQLILLSKFLGNILVLHVSDPLFFNQSRRDRISRVNGYMRSLLVRFLPRIHVATAGQESKLRNSGFKGKIYTFPFFFPNSKVNIPSVKDFVVLFAGRLEIVSKGIDLLGSVIEKVLLTEDKIIFRIAGSGQEGEVIIKSLVERFPDNVFWLGHLSESDLQTEYERASVFAFPSRYENQPLSLLEAMNYGLLCVAFDIDGPRDLMIPGAGTLIPHYNTDIFSQTILDYFNEWKASRTKFEEERYSRTEKMNQIYKVEETVNRIIDMIAP